MKKNILFGLIFVFLATLSYIILDYEKNQKIEQHLNTKTKQYIQNYNLLYRKYKALADVIFLTKIDTKEVQSLFKNRDREKLYNYLEKIYLKLNSHSIKQLHFHLPNNESFLRFHRPHKFGDDLTNIRETVSYVNRTKKPIDGFEEGRIYNGYRFVFPLFSQKEYLGSVEVSFSTLAMNIEFMKSYGVISNFFILKDQIEQKVFASERANYIKSPFKNFCMEKEMYNYIDDLKGLKSELPISKKVQSLIDEEKQVDKSFSIYDDSRKIIITFIKVQNPVSKKTVAMFSVRSSASYIHYKVKTFYVSLFMVVLFIGVVLYFIYKEILYRDDIKQNNIKLKTIFEEADSGIALMDLNGKFLEVNYAYCELLQYSKDELLNLNCLEISSPNTKEKAKLVLKRVIKNGSISKIRKECISKNGDLLNLELSLKLLPSQNVFIAVINSLEDKLSLERLNNNLQLEIDHAIEDLRIKDALLSRQSKMAAMGEMIDSIAHQWMQPIGIIRMKFQMLELDLQTSEISSSRLQEVIQSGEYQIKHLINTIHEFRAFFRPNSKIEEIPLRAIIDATLLLTKDELIKNNIQTKIIGDKTAVVKINASEFKHVVINIINNAKDAFNDNNIDKQDREIVFEIIKKDNKTILMICDNAGGIPENIINHIFEANFTTKKEDKGTGIGLYMTKQIIDKHNAIIEVKNTDKGACFRILI